MQELKRIAKELEKDEKVFAAIGLLYNHEKREHAKTHKRLDNLQWDVNCLKEEMVEVKEDIRGLKEEMVEVKEDIRGLKEEMVEVKEDIRGLKEDVKGLKQEMGDVNKRLDGIEYLLKVLVNRK